MISITTKTYDLDGVIAFESYQDFKSNTARVNRQKTLDGGAYINHAGVSAGDMTFNISKTITEAQAETMWYIFENYTLLNIATDDGFFTGAIESLQINNGAMTCAVLIQSKEA